MSATSDDTPTTWPRPRARINGNSGRIVASAPVKFVAITSAASTASIFHTEV